MPSINSTQIHTIADSLRKAGFSAEREVAWISHGDIYIGRTGRVVRVHCTGLVTQYLIGGYYDTPVEFDIGVIPPDKLGKPGWLNAVVEIIKLGEVDPKVKKSEDEAKKSDVKKRKKRKKSRSPLDTKTKLQWLELWSQGCELYVIKNKFGENTPTRLNTVIRGSNWKRRTDGHLYQVHRDISMATRKVYLEKRRQGGHPDDAACLFLDKEFALENPSPPPSSPPGKRGEVS